MDDYLNLQEAAELLGVSRWTVWRRVRTGQLPTYTAGVDQRARLIKRADVEALMQPQLVLKEREGKAAA